MKWGLASSTGACCCIKFILLKELDYSWDNEDLDQTIILFKVTSTIYIYRLQDTNTKQLAMTFKPLEGEEV